jgi:VIT1/CCC1 family predicted Fe2+/Mn2+ transporter
VGINSVVRSTKPGTLRSAKARLARGGATDAELAAIEQQLLGAEVPFGPLTLATPFGVGALIAVAPAFDPKSNTNERNVSIVVGSALAVTGIVVALASEIVPSYRAGLWRAGLSLTASPPRADLTYRF